MSHNNPHPLRVTRKGEIGQYLELLLLSIHIHEHDLALIPMLELMPQIVHKLDQGYLIWGAGLELSFSLLVVDRRYIMAHH